METKEILPASQQGAIKKPENRADRLLQSQNDQGIVEKKAILESEENNLDREREKKLERPRRTATERKISFLGKEYYLGDVEMALIVLVVGAMGGRLAAGLEWKVFPIWSRNLESSFSGVISPINPWWLAPIGAAAAGITIFYIAKSDTRNVLHTVFFALLCGLCGPSVLDKAMGSMANEEDSFGVVNSENAERFANAGKIAKEEPKKAISELGDTNAVAMATKDAAQTKAALNAEVDAQKIAIKTPGKIGDIALANPEALEDAKSELVKVSVDATNRGNAAVAEQVAITLDRLPASISIETDKANPDSKNLKGILAKDAAIISTRVKDVDPMEVRIQYFKEQDQEEARRLVQRVAENLNIEVYPGDGKELGFGANPNAIKEKAYVYYLRRGELNSNISPRRFELRLGSERLKNLAALKLLKNSAKKNNL